MMNFVLRHSLDILLALTSLFVLFILTGHMAKIYANTTEEQRRVNPPRLLDDTARKRNSN